jgi:hypothetical protein
MLVHNLGKIDKYWLQDGHMDDAELWYAEIKEIKNLVNVK